MNASNGHIPRRAEKKEDLNKVSRYLVRADHDGGRYLGTFLPEEGVVNITVKGEVISKSKYQVDIPSSVVVI